MGRIWVSVNRSTVSDSATPWTVAHQAPLSMEFPRQEYWSGLSCPSPGDLLDPGIEPKSPALQVDSLPSGWTVQFASCAESQCQELADKCDGGPVGEVPKAIRARMNLAQSASQVGVGTKTPSQLVTFNFLNFIYVYLFIWLCCASSWVLFPQLAIEPWPLAVKVQSHNHWTAREFPFQLFLNSALHSHVVQPFLPSPLKPVHICSLTGW